MPGDGLHSFNFSPGGCRGSFGQQRVDHSSSGSTGGRWLYRSYIPGGHRQGSTRDRRDVTLTSLTHANRAIVTIDDQARILTANDVCTALLGRSEDELCGGRCKLTDFLHFPSLSTSTDALNSPSIHSSTDGLNSPSFPSSVNGLLQSISFISLGDGQQSVPHSTSASDLQSPLANGISRSPSLTPAVNLRETSPQHSRNTGNNCQISSEESSQHSANIKDPSQSFTASQHSGEATVRDNEGNLSPRSSNDGDLKCENIEEVPQASLVNEVLVSIDNEACISTTASHIIPEAESHTLQATKDTQQESNAHSLSSQSIDPNFLSPKAALHPDEASSDSAQAPSVLDSSSTFSDSSTLSDVTHEYEVMKREGLVLFSGKVVSVQSENGGQQFCSLWLKALPCEDNDEGKKEAEGTTGDQVQGEEKDGKTEMQGTDGQRWVAVLEPVDLVITKASLDNKGHLLSHDPTFPTVFGHPAQTDLTTEGIAQFLPTLKLPPHNDMEIEQELAWQECTGRTIEHTAFPLQAALSRHQHNIELEIWVVRDLSGLVVVNCEGSIVDYNRSFSRLMFGYTDDALLTKNITELIPEVYEEIRLQRGRGVVGRVLAAGRDKDPSVGQQGTTTTTHDPTSSSSTLADLPSSITTPNKAFIATDSKLEGSVFTCESSPSRGVDGGDNDDTSQAMRDITNSLNFINISHQNLSGGSLNQGSSVNKTPTSPRKLHRLTKVAPRPDLTPGVMMESGPQVVTSTPAPERTNKTQTLEDGVYCGHGRHRDRAHLAILYHVRRVEVSGVPHYCLWITRHNALPEISGTEDTIDQLREGAYGDDTMERLREDVEGEERTEDEEGSPRRPDCLSSLPPPMFLSTTQPSPLTESTDISLGHVIRSQARRANNDRSEDADDEDTDIERTDDEAPDNKHMDDNEEERKEEVDDKEKNEEDSDDDSHHTSTNGSSGAEYSLIHSRRGNLDDTTSSCVDEEMERQTSGEFSRQYTVLRQIGKGAFGCVRMSVRNSDGLLVVTKFIKKGKVYKDSWVDDLLLKRRVPLEVSLLMTLSHPNIVSVHDMYEGDDYFQLVMEKWGAGMDLFEFIDRNPVLDEPLAAHIFRQIVSALRYLHSLSIVHRDVKDENVILDSNFHVKLIDFGSAAFTRPGRTFAQFAGTVEYCSPEVLKGNRYSGYELEVWSLGVTMYTLMYGENPFYDIDQTISAALSFPFQYSTELTSLLSGMLEKEAAKRTTMEEVARHPWTQTSCVIEDYPFHEVVRCTYEECHPPTHVPVNGGADTSLSTTSDSFVYHPATPSRGAGNQARRSLSFSPHRRRSLNDNDVARLQRSATSLSSSRLSGDFEDRLEEEVDGEVEDVEVDGRISPFPISSGASRTSTSQSVSSLRSTITVDSSSFSCCSPSAPSTHPDTSTSQTSTTHPTTTTTTTDDDSSTSQLDSSSAHLDSSSAHLDSSSARLDSSSAQLDVSSTRLDSTSHLDSISTQLDSFTQLDTNQYDSMLSGQV